MCTHRIAIGLSAAIVLTSTSLWAQQPGSEKKPVQRGRASAADEQLQERQVDMLTNEVTRIYSLKQDQVPKVRAEIRKAADETRAASATTEQELKQVNLQMGRYWQEWTKRAKKDPNAGSKPWENPDYMRLLTRKDELMAQKPFVYHSMVDRVEKILPPDQVKRAHQQNSDWFQRWAHAVQATGDKSFERRKYAVSAWEEYTMAVVAMYNFDAAQANAAKAVLKDVQDRGRAVQRSRPQQLKTPQLPTVKKPAGDTKVKPRAPTSDEQLERLFDELKKRLDELVTEEQRRKSDSASKPDSAAGKKKPGSKP